MRTVKFFDAETRQQRQAWQLSVEPITASHRAAPALPSGHPEGYIEAFAAHYTEVALAIKDEMDNTPIPSDVNFPTITDGVKGLAYIEAAVRSSQANARCESRSRS